MKMVAGQNDEQDLLEQLDKLDRQGIKFALSKKTKQEKVHLFKNVLLFYFIQLRS